jgi:hypothetical protein
MCGELSSGNGPGAVIYLTAQLVVSREPPVSPGVAQAAGQPRRHHLAESRGPPVSRSAAEAHQAVGEQPVRVAFN